MKRYIVLLALCVITASQVLAQDNTEKQYLPEKGDFSLGIDVAPMFKYVGRNIKDKEKIIDLTVKELKEVIREVVAEEISKHNFAIPPVPVQPFYYQPVQPWEAGKVYCTTNTKDNTIKG